MGYRVWNPEDSDALDRDIKAERQRDTQAQTKKQFTGPARGWATDEDLGRRQAATRHLTQRNPEPERRATVRWPQPKQQPNGRWRAACVHHGELHTRTFDTRAEAEQFIREIKES